MASLGDLIARLLGRGGRSQERERLQLPAVPTSADLLQSLTRVEEMVAGTVPAMVTFRVDRVVATVRETVPRLSALGAGSPRAHSVMATATNYLPEAIGAYLRLPRSWADSRPVEGGRTSLMVLCDQLDLLADTMDEVLDAVCRGDADALVAHGRFLAEKFGPAASGGGLDLGAIPPGSAAPPDPSIPPGPAASEHGPSSGPPGRGA